MTLGFGSFGTTLYLRFYDYEAGFIFEILLYDLQNLFIKLLILSNEQMSCFSKIVLKPLKPFVHKKDYVVHACFIVVIINPNHLF